MTFVEAITESVRQELFPSERRRIPSLEEVYGIGSVEGVEPPTDEEIRESYTDYLIEKYK